MAEASSPNPMSGEQIRNAFLTFFADRGHQVLSSASLVPDDPTVLLTIAGMLPFKPVFLGQQTRPAARATSSQKCIRTNDIENVGRTARHQTFFEMLGNFSFGDYFKKEAIYWAWELSTDVFGLDPQNLVVSVFKDDDEAEEIWREEVGVKPERIIRMGKKDNFWSSGPTGPCGPCSELYYDFHPELGDKYIDLEDDTRFIEFYNLVFMQYNRDDSGSLTPLANCNIDTGMGLERMAQILQRVPNNYETDLIFPLLKKGAELANVNYNLSDNKTRISLKVIADHVRAVTHLICDGVKPSNLGRGYVLRRLLRRAIRHGRLIGIRKPFLVDIGAIAIEMMQSAYPQLLDRRDVIFKEMQSEESRFLETLGRGEKLLSDLLLRGKANITGDKAFELYDTYGFPLELTQEIAEEHNLSVDLEGFENAMLKQRQRAKAASVTVDLTVQDAIERIATKAPATSFLGYESLDHSSRLIGLVTNGQIVQQACEGDYIQIILDETVFYAEAGGQIGDCGLLTDKNNQDLLVRIDKVTRIQDVFVHVGCIQKGALKVGDLVTARVDSVARRRAQTHHTATHLLQAALKNVVQSDISQAGSLVDFDRLRFDFNSPRPITQNELDEIEKLINLWIADAHHLNISEMGIEQARRAGAVAMFGEKYGETVRVVDVPGVSMELCGGTHVANTVEIGLFKIISESGIAAGIRRIEAVAGQAVLEYLNERDFVVRSLSEQFKTQPSDLLDRIKTLQSDLKLKTKALSTASEELAVAKVTTFLNQVTIFSNSKLLVKRLDGVDGSALQLAATNLVDQLGQNSAVILGGLPDVDNLTKVVLVAAFGSEIIATGLQAGQFIGKIAKRCGGGGGGRPNLAQAGGRDGKALNPALAFALEELKSSLT